MHFDPSPTNNHSYYMRLERVLGQTKAGSSALLDTHGDLAAEQIERLARACLSKQEDVRLVVESWIRAGCDLEEVYLQGVSKAARLMGGWWYSDHLDFASMTIACYRLHQLMFDLSPTFLANASIKTHGLSALLAATPGSHHTMGVLMLSEFFRREGWNVTREVPETHKDLLRMVETEWFDLVGISVNHNQTVAEVRAMIMQIRQVCPNERLQVMVGGLIPGNRVQFTQEVGADLLGTDARESQLMALELVTGKAAHVPKRQQRAS